MPLFVGGAWRSILCCRVLRIQRGGVRKMSREVSGFAARANIGTAVCWIGLGSAVGLMSSGMNIGGGASVDILFVEGREKEYGSSDAVVPMLTRV